MNKKEVIEALMSLARDIEDEIKDMEPDASHGFYDEVLVSDNDLHALKAAIAILSSAQECVYAPHKFWGAGEADCPADIKASNGELHTLRCKVCGKDNNKQPCSSSMIMKVVPDAEPFGFYNLTCKQYIHAEEYAATEWNQELLETGKVIRLYAALAKATP
jgi:hypothetical protein